MDDSDYLYIGGDGQLTISDNIYIGLHELTGSPGLRTLPAPNLLDLVAAERKREIVIVLRHVAREGYREIEVEPELRLLRLSGMDAMQAVYLAVIGSLGDEHLEPLGRGRLDGREARELVGTPDRVYEDELGNALLREELGESGNLLRFDNHGWSIKALPIVSEKTGLSRQSRQKREKVTPRKSILPWQRWFVRRRILWARCR